MRSVSLLTLTISLFSTFTIHAETTVNERMNNISQSVVKILPMLVSPSKFAAEENQKVITSTLETIANEFKALEIHPELNRMGTKINKQVIQKQITTTQQLMQQKNYSLARWSFNSTLSLCVSCHSQMPESKKLFGQQHEAIEKLQLSEFEKAEFLFLTHNFDQANEHYENLMVAFKGEKDLVIPLEKALERSLTYHVRIKHSLTGAKAMVEKALANKLIPNFLREILASWKKETDKLIKKNPAPKVATASEKEIKRFLGKSIAPLFGKSDITVFEKHQVQALFFSDVLYQLVNSRSLSQGLTPEVFYWLAIFDKNLNHDLFYSFGDIYLQDCIYNYAQLPVAKKCFDKYHEFVEDAFTGSSGTSIPEDVQTELNLMEEIVKNKGAPPTAKKIQ